MKSQLHYMTAQDVSDLIEADISDDWKVIVAEICKGEASCDAPANLAIKLKEAFEKMDDFANGVGEDEFDFDAVVEGMIDNAERAAACNAERVA